MEKLLDLSDDEQKVPDSLQDQLQEYYTCGDGTKKAFLLMRNSWNCNWQVAENAHLRFRSRVTVVKLDNFLQNGLISWACGSICTYFKFRFTAETQRSRRGLSYGESEMRFSINPRPSARKHPARG